MSARKILGLSQKTLLQQGEPDEVAAKERKAYAENVRPERLKAARRNSRWTEIRTPRSASRWPLARQREHGRGLHARAWCGLPFVLGRRGRRPSPVAQLRRRRRRAALLRAAPRNVDAAPREEGRTGS